MTSLPNLVKKKIDPRCLAKGKVKKEGCAVKMTNISAQMLVTDLDRPGSPLRPDEKRCDYLLLATDEQADEQPKDLVVALELKRGKLDARKVVSQLQAGAHAAEKLVPKSRVVRFRPVAVFGTSHRHERIELRKPENEIAFHGHRESVQMLSCGNSLTKVP
ncbi:MAG: hypothetical protein OXC91_14880 [Rhodobacteraceae bacterium]|nr:hypothetical protein [Paracoccaceae bacterium]